MKSGDRRSEIMALLLEAGAVSVDQLAARFDVSKMTIHRDLDELEESGFLRKVRGGASVQSSSRFESDYRYRENIAALEKERIAIAAAALVEPGQSIIIDDSSTAGRIAGHLLGHTPLTVITNNLSVIQALSETAGINLIALGGQYSRKFNGFFGLVAEDALRSLRADLAFLSSSAIHGSAAFHQDQEVVHTKRLMMAAAEHAYMLVDPGKFNRRALHFMADLRAFEAVITCGPLPPELERDYRTDEIALQLAGPGGALQAAADRA